MKWMGKKAMSAMLAMAMMCTVGASSTLMASAAAGSNKLRASDTTQSSENGGWNTTTEPGTDEVFTNNNDGETTTTGEASYSVPVTLKTVLANYQVTLEWGELALVYDATQSIGGEWGTSFDGTNNLVKATNTGRNDVTVSMAYSNGANNTADYGENVANAVEALHLGLTANNAEYSGENNIDNDEYPLDAVTTDAEGKTVSGGTVNEYLNLRDDAADPEVVLDNATHIGDITVTVKPAPATPEPTPGP